jgi:hypothetical protein
MPRLRIAESPQWKYEKEGRLDLPANPIPKEENWRMPKSTGLFYNKRFVQACL